MRLQLDARARRFLRRIPVVNVYSAAELALAAVLAGLSAQLVWVLATPVGPLGDWRPAGPVVPGSARDILTGFDPFFRLGGGNAEPAVVTSLQLTLFGTRLDEASGRGAAIIAGADAIQKSVAVGDEIQPGVRLKAVAFDHVTIDRGGAEEDLFLDQSGNVATVTPAVPATPVAPAAPGAAPVVPPPAGGGMTIAQLRSDIGFIPRIDGGRLTGLVVRPQGSGAGFRAAGLSEGDIVTAIGGRPVTGQGDIDRIATDFAGGGTIPLTVERGDQTLPLSIRIAGK